MTLRAIFHLNQPERWQIALTNIRNLIKDVGRENLQVIVLANGGAVQALLDPDMLKEMESLSSEGIRFLVCRNSIRNLCSSGLCLDEESLPDFIEVVPAGITELIRRQADGYAYLKP